MSQNATQPRDRAPRPQSAAGSRASAQALSALLETAALTRVRRSTIHGRGLFSATVIPEGTYLGRYEGEVTERDGCYVLWVENEARDDVYGVRGRNSLRFVNHSPRPNAEFDGEELFALRRIEPEEEITVDYGPEWAEED